MCTCEWRRRRTRSRICSSCLALVATSVAAQQGLTDQQITNTVESAGRFGVSYYRGLSAALQVGRNPPPNLAVSTPQTVEADFQRLASSYQAQMLDAAATGQIIKNSASLMISVGQLAATSTGVGAVPATLVAGAANYVAAGVATSVTASGQAKAKVLLSKQLETWNQSAGNSYEDIRQVLKAGNSAEAINRLNTATGLLTTLNMQLAGDVAGQAVAQKYIIETISTTSLATLQAAVNNGTAIADLQGDFTTHAKLVSNFARQTEKRLNTLSIRIQSVDNALREANTSIQTLTSQQGATTEQIGLIQQVMFSKEPASSQLWMIQNGMLPQLDAEQRRGMENYLKAQVQKEELVKSTAKIVNVAQSLGQLMTNLGVSDPKIGAAVAFGTGAQAAFSQIGAGNYLGAIVSVSGMFGRGSPSPEAQRHAQLMAALGDIDEKLNKVVELQKKTLAAVEQLSVQVSKYDQRLNERLAGIAFETKTTSENLRMLIWSDYASCGTAWKNTNLGANRFDPSSLRYVSMGQLLSNVSFNANDLASCSSKLEKLFATIVDQQTFGNWLSLSSAVNQSITEAQFNPTQNEEYYSKSELEQFLALVHRPTFDLITNYWTSKRVNGALIFGSYASPAQTVGELNARLSRLETTKSDRICAAEDQLGARLRPFLCGDSSESSTADRRARLLLRDPIVRGQLQVIGAWVALVAPTLDVRDPGTKKALTVAELDRGSPLKGTQLVSDFISVVDTSVAQQAMLHGDLTAAAVLDLLWSLDGRVFKSTDLASNEKRALDLLKNENGRLLRLNVSNLLLHRLTRTTGDARIPYESALRLYSKLDLEKIDPVGLFVAEQALRSVFAFPPNVTLSVKYEHEDSKTGRKLLMSWPGGLSLELVDAVAFGEGRLFYPPEVAEAAELKRRFVDLYVDRTLFHSLDVASYQRVSTILYLGLHQDVGAQE
jgi:hypothetical protein